MPMHPHGPAVLSHILNHFFPECRERDVPASPPEPPGWVNMLSRILEGQAQIISNQHRLFEELRKMSDAQTQQQKDITQLTADVSTIKTQYASLVDQNGQLVAQVAALKAASDANSGAVPAELQAQIDAVHDFAQSITPAPVDQPVIQQPDPNAAPVSGTQIPV